MSAIDILIFHSLVTADKIILWNVFDVARGCHLNRSIALKEKKLNLVCTNFQNSVVNFLYDNG